MLLITGLPIYSEFVGILPKRPDMVTKKTAMGCAKSYSLLSGCSWISFGDRQKLQPSSDCDETFIVRAIQAELLYMYNVFVLLHLMIQFFLCSREKSIMTQTLTNCKEEKILYSLVMNMIMMYPLLSRYFNVAPPRLHPLSESHELDVVNASCNFLIRENN